MKKVIYYNSLDCDVIEAKDQEYKLKDNYKWVRTDFSSKVLSGIIYFFALVISFVYLHFVLRMKIIKNKELKKEKEGYFIYSNHTQVVGDVFIAAHVAFIKRIYTIVSPSNFSIPFIGKLLPYLGALPTSRDLSGLKELNKGVSYRISKGKVVVIFPEAHVWPYCSFIRPYSDTSFKYPIKLDKNSYSVTVTYLKTKLRKRPKMVIYVDGPFKEETKELLKEKIEAVMIERSKLSDIEYIKYEKSKSNI